MPDFKPKNDEVLNHWIAFTDNFQLSVQEFYEALEKELAARKIPGLEISRVDYAEGGLLSEKRIYLRMIRERLAFDACAAPFGTGFFFSCRTVHSPAVIRLWQVLAILCGLGALFVTLLRPLGLVYTTIAVAGLVLAVIQMFRLTIALKLANLDAALLKSSVVGSIYEKYFRVDTYYRQDTRLVYLEVVPKLVQAVAEDLTATKGVKLVRQYERAPILGELYKPRQPTVKSPGA